MDANVEDAIRTQLLGNAEIRARFGPLLNLLLSNEGKQVEEIKSQVTELAEKLAEMNANKGEKKPTKAEKEAKSKIRAEIIQLLTEARANLSSLIPEKKPDSNDIGSFLRKRGFNLAQAKSLPERGTLYCSFVVTLQDERQRELDIQVDTDGLTPRLLEKISDKKYEINFAKLFSQATANFYESGRTGSVLRLSLDPEKVEEYFIALEARKKTLRENPKTDNDLGFFQNAGSAYYDDSGCDSGPFIRIRFPSAIASIDTSDRRRIKLLPNAEYSEKETRRDIKKEMRELGHFALEHFLNQATLNVDFQGTSLSSGSEIISIAMCPVRAENFLEKFAAMNKIKNCTMAVADKDKGQPFCRFSPRSGLHTNLFAKDIKFTNGSKHFNGEEFFKDLSRKNAGDFLLDYLYSAATKIATQEPDGKHPGKFLVEVDPKKHAKWVAEHLSDRN